MRLMGTDIDFLRLRLLEQSYKYGKSHLGSSFSTLPILKEIYDQKNPDDRFVLSNGHAASSLYVCIEAYLGVNSDSFFVSMGDHPKRSPEFGVDCSTGSLGMGITVAVGMAIANPHRLVYCVVSDGECAEGSFWEAIRFINKSKIENIKVYVNINNFSAYDVVDGHNLGLEILALYPQANLRFTTNYPFEHLGLEAHYFKMNEFSYNEIKEKLCASTL